MAATTILIVDDEYDLVRLVRYNLEKEGYKVLTAYDGQEALRQVKENSPELVILDLMLPDMPGYDICKQLKAEPETEAIPVIMLTARSSEDDKISGFQAGAEDYVVKPFSPKELIYRVKAMLGRTQKNRSALPKDIRIGPLVIFPNDHCVSIASEDGSSDRNLPIALSHLEFKLLLSLAASPNMVKTREQLIADVWEQDGEDISDRTVDTHVKRLRQKLGEARDMIETIRGVGYRITTRQLQPV
ncbi:MAG: response regulator transcription factor [Cyanobacteria bacterium HKST-UBA04]|nr:response regulator transcription factor [Cyanobacteria bacterium HKST-UBA05]MCA9799747.1 response regulator transcription factor [Cyanobacteria bacterium HKST-UBA04]MCA9840775.1 response regulator transcription factor [Cyanobacteria bacterium HKST-UBA03]